MSINTTGAACATCITFDATLYSYSGDTTHNVELNRSINLTNALYFDTWQSTGPSLTKNIINGIVYWDLTADYTLTESIFLQSNEYFIISADLIIGPSGNLIVSGELDISGGSIDISGGTVSSVSPATGNENFLISGGDFYELFYNNQRMPRAKQIKDKKFLIPRFYRGSWTYGYNRDVSMNDTEIENMLNLYTWNIGTGDNTVPFNLANFAINQWLIDISNNKTLKTTIEEVTTDTSNNTVTTYSDTGSSIVIPSTNVRLRNELLLQSYLYNIPYNTSVSLSWGNLLKTLDRAEGTVSTRFDLVNTPKNALQSGDIITVVFVVRNGNPYTESIFIRLPFQIK